MRISGRDEARAALAQARLAGRPIRLVSPAAAAGYHGIGWWRALVAELARDFPDVTFDAVLDCGSAAGLALEALRAGVTDILLAAPPSTLKAVGEIATALGARVVAAEGLAALPLPSGGRG